MTHERQNVLRCTCRWARGVVLGRCMLVPPVFSAYRIPRWPSEMDDVHEGGPPPPDGE